MKRVFPYRWKPEQPRYAHIYRIWDKNLESERAVNPYIQSRGQPLYIQEDEAGVLNLGYIHQLKGDIMWYRVIIHADKNWKGYLEFCAPTGDNRRAYSRHKITLRLTSDR